MGSLGTDARPEARRKLWPKAFLLLALAVLVAVVVGVVWPRARQERAVRKLRQHGCTVQTRRGTLGDQIVGVALHSEHIHQLPANALAEQVGGLSSIERLRLGGSTLTDAGLAHIGRLKGLVELNLAFTRIRDEGLAHLAGLRHLERLNLAHTGVGDAAVEHLLRVPSLEGLVLADTQVTAAGVERLAALKGLEFVFLDHTQLDGAAALQHALPELAIVRRFRPGLPREEEWGPHVNAVALSPDGGVLATVDYLGGLRVFDVATGKEVLSRGIQRSEGPSSSGSVAFSPDGRILASGGRDGLTLWDPATGKRIAALEGHSLGVDVVAFSPDGRLLVSAGNDGTVRLWDVAGREELRKLEGHGNLVNALAFSPDGALLASGGEDHTARLWDVASGAEVLAMPHPQGVACVAIDPNGTRLATGSGSTTRLWDATTGRAILEIDTARGIPVTPAPQLGHTPEEQVVQAVFEALDRLMVQGLAFSPDGRYLVAGTSGPVGDGDANTVRLWDPTTGEELAQLEGHWYLVRSLAFSRDGRLLASGGGDAMAHVWPMDRLAGRIEQRRGRPGRRGLFAADKHFLGRPRVSLVDRRP